jgi:hypothetical protein
MNKIKNYSEFNSELNEADLGIFKTMPVFARAIANPFSLSIAPQIVTMMDGDINDEASIMEPYKKIFQKACIKFGGGKPGNVGKTCNKDLTLQALAEFYFDPAKGKMDPKAITKWLDETTKDHDPSAEGEWEVTAADMDEIVMKFVDLLKRTGVTPGGIKKTGTYLLTIGLPMMKRFYKPEDIEKMKMITSGQLMDVAKAKEFLAGGAKGGELSLD